MANKGFILEYVCRTLNFVSPREMNPALGFQFLSTVEAVTAPVPGSIPRSAFGDFNASTGCKFPAVHFSIVEKSLETALKPLRTLTEKEPPFLGHKVLLQHIAKQQMYSPRNVPETSS